MLSYSSGLNLLQLMVSLLNYISFLALKEHTSINKNIINFLSAICFSVAARPERKTCSRHSPVNQGDSYTLEKPQLKATKGPEIPLDSLIFLDVVNKTQAPKTTAFISKSFKSS